ncbi:MAG: alpha/beta fold hydrolase [Rhodospirillaceae bacterium]|nr:alpha/beta fold hydrolase [Rhodospirillaceae bacterium]
MRFGTAAAIVVAVALVGAAGFGAVYERDWLFGHFDTRRAAAELVKRPCGFTTASGRDLVCYDLTVPEVRGRAGSRRITLPIMVFEAPERPKKDDPVLLIGGGPGAIAYTEARFAGMWKDKFKDLPWMKGRDLIVYDQRGVGGARPALNCPEFDATRSDPLNIERARLAMIACRDRLEREGTSLAAYDTNANVDDILALQAALHVKAWNLWGQSYGTRVALALMRRNPPGVRSVILDGAYPPEVSGKLYLAKPFVATLDRVFEACGKDESCRSDYPELRERFVAALTRLRTHPVEIKSDPSPLLPPQVFRVNDVLFLSIIENILYTADGIAQIPWLIDRVADGKDTVLEDSIVDWDLVSFGPYVTAGVSYLVDCNDTPAADDRDEREVAQSRPELAPWLRFMIAFKPCPIWTPRKAPALDAAPVKSDIPTLVIAGWFDLATPPEWGAQAVRSLSRGQLVLVQSRSHDASDQSCAQAALATFIDKPEAELGLFCGPSPSHPDFKRKSEKD